jgi:hypothetical protein
LGDESVETSGKAPLYYVDYSLPVTATTSLASFIGTFLYGPEVVFLGSSQQAATPLLYSMNSDKLVIAHANGGYLGSSHQTAYGYDDLKVDDLSTEGKCFERIYDHILQDANDQALNINKDFSAINSIGTSNILFNTTAPLFTDADPSIQSI